MSTEIILWPSVRDVARDLDVTPAWVMRLIKRGQMRAVQTRLGKLVDPESVAA